MPEEAIFRCDNPDCRVEETGKCVEGLALTECPHFGRTSPVIGEPPRVDEREDIPERGLRLPSGDRLTTSAAASVLRAGDAHLAAILGPTDSGKTSLIASLYDLFQEGSVEGLSFAGSRTLHAFEQACHDARAASRRVEPSIDRTRIGGVAFYHLVLGGINLGLLNLLLADRAGEEYRTLADEPSIGAGFVELTRADTLNVLVDGARLLDSGARHNVRSEVVMTLQALIDGNMAKPGQRVALVLTKFDAIAESPLQKRVESDFNALLLSVRRLFGNSYGTVEPFQTAASPKSMAVKRGFGVAALLRFWLNQRLAQIPSLNAAPPASKRAIGRLTVLDI